MARVLSAGAGAGPARRGCDQAARLGNGLLTAASVRSIRSSAVAEALRSSLKDEWRDHVLGEIVTFLSENKEQIHARYLEQRDGQYASADRRRG